MSAYGADICVAATNRSFNEDAYQHWASLDSSGIEAYLWDGDALLNHYREPPVGVSGAQRIAGVPSPSSRRRRAQALPGRPGSSRSDGYRSG